MLSIRGGPEIPVAVRGFRLGEEVVGSRSRGLDGSLRETVTARLQAGTLSTIPLPRAEALAWYALLAGLGEVWSFDAEDLYGSKGTEADPSAEAYSSSPRYGAAAFEYQDGHRVAFPLPPGGEGQWTAMWWAWDSTATTWLPYMLRSDGSAWIAGSPVAFVDPLEVLEEDGAVLFATLGETIRLDDVIILPELLPAAFHEAHAAADEPFSPLPFLHLSGELLRRPGRFLLDLSADSPTPHQSEEGWEAAGRSLTFRFEEG